MNRSYNWWQMFVSRSLFWLTVFSVFCLCIVGTGAKGALPPTLLFFDYQGSKPANATVENHLSAPSSTADVRKEKGAESRQVTAAGSTGEAILPVSLQNSTTVPSEMDQDIPVTVANFLSNPTGAEEAMELFRTADSRRNKTEKDYEALHRLLWYAMQLGSVDAALAYGRLFDPLEPQWWTVEKDTERALSFYQSVALQNPEAQASMNRLRNRVDKGMPKQ